MMNYSAIPGSMNALKICALDIPGYKALNFSSVTSISATTRSCRLRGPKKMSTLFRRVHSCLSVSILSVTGFISIG